MKRYVAAIAMATLALASVSAPVFAQTAPSTATCPPNGNAPSAGIVGKGNGAGAVSGAAQAGTATTQANCPTTQSGAGDTMSTGASGVAPSGTAPAAPSAPGSADQTGNTTGK